MPATSANLKGLDKSRVNFVKGNICDPKIVEKAIQRL